MNKLIIPLICAIALGGCINREQADTRLERGCRAAAELFIDEGFSIKSIKKNAFSLSKEFGQGYRNVKLTAIETDDWIDLDKDIECIFAEDMGAFGLSHSASLYQLKINDEIYGVEKGKLLGDIDTHLKITIAVENAMAQH